MLEGNDGDRRTVGESYSVAVGASSLKLEPHRSAAIDLIAASGMNRFRMGTALMRLASEWNSGATPPPATAPSAKELRRQGVPAEDVPEEHRRRAAQVANWNEHENMLRFQRLKTLPTIRAGLLHWVRERGWEEAEHMVAAVLQHFLSPLCPVCHGRGAHVVAGTARTGRACKECKATGLSKVPHGGRGQRLLDYLQVCVGQAGHDLREGAHRLRRGSANTEARANQRAREHTEALRRADAEAAEDAKQDREAVAEGFRRSLGQRRL